jgi:hypothetical protein
LPLCDRRLSPQPIASRNTIAIPQKNFCLTWAKQNTDLSRRTSDWEHVRLARLLRFDLMSVSQAFHQSASKDRLACSWGYATRRFMRPRVLWLLLALHLMGCSSDADSGDSNDGGSGNTDSGGSANGGTGGSHAGATGSDGGTTSNGGTGGSSAGNAGDASGGDASGGTAGTSGGENTGGAPSGEIAKTTLACLYGGTEVNYCSGTSKPHYWECSTPSTSPYDGCETPTDSPPEAARWCCDTPFCSPYAGVDGICVALYPTMPKGYICATETPGLEACTQPNPISLAQVYCCP